MVTKLLYRAGLYLGPERKLIPAAADNQDGFWENVDFVALNDAILGRSGGAWDSPPPSQLELRNDWRGRLLQARARLLVARFSHHAEWGWKDPRNSLTLSLWLQLIPKLKVIVCVRDPFEVDESLRMRSGDQQIDGLTLWRIYNERVLAQTTLENRIVTHYDAFFRDPTAELRRILTFIGMDNQAVNEISATGVRQDLRHHTRIRQSGETQHTDARIEALYRQLCQEANC